MVPLIPAWTHFGIHISHGSHKNIPNYYTTFELWTGAIDHIPHIVPWSFVVHTT